MLDLYQRLKQYSESGVYPFHMPGHKRRVEDGGSIPYEIDITEIADFDNLHAPEKNGVLWNIYEEMTQFYDTAKSIPLVNGSTTGLMSALSACVTLEDEVIVARNCHKAVYRTCELLGLKAHYVYPDYWEEIGVFGNFSYEKLEDCMEQYAKSKVVVVTSPTYEGVILDIHRIAELVHKHNMLLLVDEAHGAHLPFAQREKSAIYQGADLVVQSLHKTLPALTQTAVLHICKGAVEREKNLLKKVEQYTSLYQTSSPSYVLMASMAQCFNNSKQWHESGRFLDYYKMLEKERQEYKKLRHMYLLDREDVKAYDYDSSRFVFVTKRTDMSGGEVMQQLRESYQIECEMASKDYVTAITTVCDTKEGFIRLREAIFDIDQMIDQRIKRSKKSEPISGNEKTKEKNGISQDKDHCGKQAFAIPKTALSLRQAMESKHIKIELQKLQLELENESTATSSVLWQQDCQGVVSAGYIMIYPPGIPMIAPGEVFSKEIVEQIVQAQEKGLNVLGVEEGKVDVISS